MGDPFRLCPIRLILPTTDNASSTPEWSDVAFAYLRQLHRYAQANPINYHPLPNILVLVQGQAMVDFHPESRWHPYASWFLGRCPEPAKLGCPPTLVNVVIGAGEAIDIYWTPGCVNILITGHGIPPHKLNWFTNRAWKYDVIMTMSTKHSKTIDDLREKRRALAAERLQIAKDKGLVPDPNDQELADSPLKMTIVVPPNENGLSQLVLTLQKALDLCVKESEIVQ